jgi:acetyltransferase-like isoleucine patch superfamily enzyme
VARAETLMLGNRLLRRIWMWRWWQTLLAASRSVRLHPTALLLGSGSRFIFGRNVKVGARTVLDTGSTGSLWIGDHVWISSDVEMQTSTHIAIDRGATIQRRCTINGTSRIGAGCILAPNVFVSSGTHPFKVFPALPIREQERRIALSRDVQYDSLDRAVWIQADCWLGTNVVVCPGVTIGKGSVIGANSVVTRDVPPYSIFAGSPAKSIGIRLNWLPPATIDAAEEGDEIYVLDGGRTMAVDGIYGFVADANSGCFAAALSNGGPQSIIRILYSAQVASRVTVGGKEFLLDQGGGVLEFGSLPDDQQQYLCVELRLLAPMSDGGLYINKVSVVSDPQ